MQTEIVYPYGAGLKMKILLIMTSALFSAGYVYIVLCIGDNVWLFHFIELSPFYSKISHYLGLLFFFSIFVLSVVMAVTQGRKRHRLVLTHATLSIPRPFRKALDLRLIDVLTISNVEIHGFRSIRIFYKKDDRRRGMPVLRMNFADEISFQDFGRRLRMAVHLQRTLQSVVPR